MMNDVRSFQDFLIAFAMIGVIGCGDSTSNMEQTGTKTEVSTAKEIPADVPVYPESQVIMVTNLPAMDGIGLETSDSINQVWGYYEKELANQNWESTESVRNEKGGGSISSKKGTRVCTIIIATEDKTGKTIVSIMVQSEKPAGRLPNL